MASSCRFTHCIRKPFSLPKSVKDPGSVGHAGAINLVARNASPIISFQHSSATARHRSLSTFRQPSFPRNSRLALSARTFSSSATTHSSIPDAEIVRESPAGRNQQRRLEEESRRQALEDDLQVALKQYEELLALFKEDECSQQRLKDSLIQLRSMYESLEYWDQALVLEEVLLDQHGASSMTHLERADTIYRQGKLHMRLGDLSQASRLYQDALAAFRQNDDDSADAAASPCIGNVLISIAGINFHRGRLQDSLNTLLEAELYFAATGTDGLPHVDLVKCLQHQGLLHRNMNDFHAASGVYKQALAVLEKIKDQVDPSVCHDKRQGLQLDLADMLAALDENEQACDLYELILRQDETFRQSTQPTALQGIIFHNLGRIHAQTEDTRELALQELTRALELKQEFVGDSHPEVLKTLNAMGAIYAVMKNKSKALQCFQQSLLIARIHANGGDGSDEDDENVMLIMRNIAVLKGEKVAKWGEE